ncbi:MAG: hypothetical protein Q8Q25_01690 [bacterium]|nr:hypothetical protein [bacterium]
MLASKRILFAFAMLSMINTIGYANDDAQVTTNVPESNKPVVVNVVSQKLEAKKRHFSMLRLLWNSTKLSFGSTLFGAGIITLPVSIVAAVGLVENLRDSRTLLLAGATFSPLFIYGGYKIMQNSFDSIRDEYIESYFGITHPNQISYSGDNHVSIAQ